MSDLVVVEYGGGPGVIITLHGGPAATGDVAPLARELGKRWRVLEPHQRGSSGQALSVATHVETCTTLLKNALATFIQFSLATRGEQCSRLRTPQAIRHGQPVSC